MLVETARLWMSLGYDGDDGQFHIDGVTGPDEYSALVDDNIYTNLMAAQNLRSRGRRRAALAAEARPSSTSTDDEVDRWRGAAERMAVPVQRAAARCTSRSRGFTAHEVWDFERSAREDEYPLLLHAPYFDLYRKQVIKQADLVLAMHWAGDAFTAEEKARAFAYYEPLTVRDSSLSACTQAVLAAEVGHLDLAADYLAEAALMDLHDLEHNAERRPAHRVAGRRLARARRRLRRHARQRRPAAVPSAAAAGLAAAALRRAAARPAARRGHRSRARSRTPWTATRRSRSPTAAATTRGRQAQAGQGDDPQVGAGQAADRCSGAAGRPRGPRAELIRPRIDPAPS